MKKNLLILHGALGAIQQFDALAAELRSHFTVHGLTFSGHGGISSNGTFGIRQFAEELKNYISENALTEVSVFGYSMGGYVAMFAASEGLELERIFTLGTKLDWTPEGAAKEITQLQPDVIEEKVPAFATHQAKLHTPLNWKSVMRDTAQLMIDLGNEPLLTETVLARVKCPVICLRGELDRMVTAAETQWAVQHLPQGIYRELPGVPHPIEKVDPIFLSRTMLNNQ